MGWFTRIGGWLGVLRIARARCCGSAAVGKPQMCEPWAAHRAWATAQTRILPHATTADVVVQLRGVRGPNGVTTIQDYPNLFVLPGGQLLSGFVDPPEPLNQARNRHLGRTAARQELIRLRHIQAAEQATEMRLAEKEHELEAARSAMLMDASL